MSQKAQPTPIGQLKMVLWKQTAHTLFEMCHISLLASNAEIYFKMNTSQIKRMKHK